MYRCWDNLCWFLNMLEMTTQTSDLPLFYRDYLVALITSKTHEGMKLHGEYNLWQIKKRNSFARTEMKLLYLIRVSAFFIYATNASITRNLLYRQEFDFKLFLYAIYIIR